MKKYGLNVDQQACISYLDGENDSQEIMKYWIPSTPEIMSESCTGKPILRSNVMGKK